MLGVVLDTLLSEVGKAILLMIVSPILAYGGKQIMVCLRLVRQSISLVRYFRQILEIGLQEVEAGREPGKVALAISHTITPHILAALKTKATHTSKREQLVLQRFLKEILAK
ncbi:MAG: hypothetical protein AABY26_02405 [Nanoarchaeota archaeon]|mgnify:CR=1 FL=1